MTEIMVFIHSLLCGISIPVIISWRTVVASPIATTITTITRNFSGSKTWKNFFFFEGIINIYCTCYLLYGSGKEKSIYLNENLNSPNIFIMKSKSLLPWLCWYDT